MKAIGIKIKRLMLIPLMNCLSRALLSLLLKANVNWGKIAVDNARENIDIGKPYKTAE